MVPYAIYGRGKQFVSYLSSDRQMLLLLSLPLMSNPVTSLQVVVIGKSAVGVGVKGCDGDLTNCEWDSVHHLQNQYTSGHRKLMLDCLGVADDQAQPSQQSTQVTIVQRHYWAGRSLLDVAQMQTAVNSTGAQVQVVNMEGTHLCCKGQQA